MASSQVTSSEVVKLCYSTQSRKNNQNENYTKQHIYRIVKRFEEIGSVIEGRHRNTGRPKSVRSFENIQCRSEANE